MVKNLSAGIIAVLAAKHPNVISHHEYQSRMNVQRLSHESDVNVKIKVEILNN